MVMPAINSALSGMAQNQQRMATAADRISRVGTTSDPGDVDLSRELVNVMESKHGYRANLSVLKAADEMIGSLLDIFA